MSEANLSPQVMLKCDNITDDIDHVCHAQTSLHLAEQLVGNRDFVRCTLDEMVRGKAAIRKEPGQLTVFSPFGLGILDIAVAKLVTDFALKQHKGTVLESSLPDSWSMMEYLRNRPVNYDE